MVGTSSSGMAVHQQSEPLAPQVQQETVTRPEPLSVLIQDDNDSDVIILASSETSDVMNESDEPDEPIFIQSLAATWDSTQSEPLFKGPILPMTYSFPRRNTDPPSYDADWQYFVATKRNICGNL